MNRPQTKTDNSYLSQKIELRLRHLPGKESILVLDVFHGTGKIWDAVKNESDKTIDVIGMDLRGIEGIVQMQGDNTKYLKAMDLSSFDVIDLDAYGVPYQQLEAVFGNGTLRHGTAVFFTFIQSVFGRLNVSMLKKIGYSSAMVRKIPTLFNRDGFGKFKKYLAVKGVKKIVYIEKPDKYYGYFVVS